MNSTMYDRATSQRVSLALRKKDVTVWGLPTSHGAELGKAHKLVPARAGGCVHQPPLVLLLEAQLLLHRHGLHVGRPDFFEFVDRICRRRI